MDCENCGRYAQPIYWDDEFDNLCETCFYELEEAKDIELVKLQKQYHEEIS